MKERAGGLMVGYWRQPRAQLKRQREVMKQPWRAVDLPFLILVKLPTLDSRADVPFFLFSHFFVAVGLEMGVPLQGLIVRYDAALPYLCLSASHLNSPCIGSHT